MISQTSLQNVLLQSLGIISSGLLSGLTLSWPIIWHTALKTTNNMNKIKLLHQSYHIAVKVMPPLILTSTIGYGLANASLTLSSILAFAILPYTKFIVLPYNEQIWVKESDSDADLDRDPTVDDLLSKWMKIHSVRFLLAFTSSIVGLYEFHRMLTGN